MGSGVPLQVAELIVIGETITMKPVHITLWLVVVCSLCLQASEAVTAADGGHPTEIAKLRAQLKDHAQLLTESRKREAETRKMEAETRKREAVLEQQVRELMQGRLPGSQPKLGQSNVVAAATDPDAGLSHAQMSRVIQAATKVETKEEEGRRRRRKGEPEKKAASGSVQADLDQQHVDGSSETLALRTPIMLASCEKSWKFQLQGSDKTITACVQCKLDAPLPLAIAKHRKRLIWACDATRYDNTTLCEKVLSWLDPPNMKRSANDKQRQKMSYTGMSAYDTCKVLGSLIKKNVEAAKKYSGHNNLTLATDAEVTIESLYTSSVSTATLKPNADLKTLPANGDPLGSTKMEVERSVHVSKRGNGKSQVFTVLSHTVMACGYIPGQPLQCVKIKSSQCVWSYVDAWDYKIKVGKKIPGKVDPEHQDQLCGPDTFLRLTTSRKL